MKVEDSAPAFPIRFVACPSCSEPDGLVLDLPRALALLRRLRPRVASYPALRLALAGDIAVLFTEDKAPLPWVEAPVAWLEAEGAIYRPSGVRLDAPPQWRAEICRRLLRHHGIVGPAALLAAREATGRLRLIDLSASRALRDIDHERLAGAMR